MIFPVKKAGAVPALERGDSVTDVAWLAVMTHFRRLSPLSRSSSTVRRVISSRLSAKNDVEMANGHLVNV